MAEAQLNGGNGEAPRALIQHDRLRAEPKHERFLRLAPPRVQRALDALRWVAKLSVPENEYSEHEASQIVTALQLQVDEVARKLARQKEQKPTFVFAPLS